MAAPTESLRTCTDWSKPTEWSDTERMHYLMAPFPPDKTSVPEEDSKFIFWSNIIIKSTTQLNRISFSISELEDRFMWNSLRPKSLDPVLSTMERKGSIVRVDTYIKQIEQKNGLMSWSLSLVSQSLSWTWRYVTGSQSSKPYQGKYVTVDRLQELCKTVYTSHNRTVVYKTTDNVMSLDQFVAVCSPHLAVPEDIHLLQAEMVRQGLLCVSAFQQGLQGVKFAPSLQEKLISRTFSDADCAVLVLKETLKHVREQLARHKENADRYYTATKLELRSKRRIEAQNQLKKGMIERKKAEAAQRKIDNMEQILERIQQAESDAMVIEAYAGGLKAMKSALNALPMNKEELEDLMDQIQDLGEQQQHIQEAMTLTEMFGEEDNIEELEQQLDQLTLSEKLNVSTSERPPPTVLATSTADDRSSEPEVVPGHSEKNSIKQLSETLIELPEVPKNNPNRYHKPTIEECL